MYNHKNTFFILLIAISLTHSHSHTHSLLRRSRFFILRMKRRPRDMVVTAEVSSVSANAMMA